MALGWIAPSILVFAPLFELDSPFILASTPLFGLDSPFIHLHLCLGWIALLPA